MITLKKAFETQNVLKTLLTNAESYLKSEANVTQTIETHLKSKANANAQDETIVVPRNSDIECSVEHVVDFCLHIATERSIITTKRLSLQSTMIEQLLKRLKRDSARLVNSDQTILTVSC